MKKSIYYATYCWREMHGNHSNTKAIRCEGEEQLRDCVMDICSLHGLMNLRINRCGKLPKNATIISFQDYKNGKFIKL